MMFMFAQMQIMAMPILASNGTDYVDKCSMVEELLVSVSPTRAAREGEDGAEEGAAANVVGRGGAWPEDVLQLLPSRPELLIRSAGLFIIRAPVFMPFTRTILALARMPDACIFDVSGYREVQVKLAGRGSPTSRNWTALVALLPGATLMFAFALPDGSHPQVEWCELAVAVRVTHLLAFVREITSSAPADAQAGGDNMFRVVQIFDFFH